MQPVNISRIQKLTSPNPFCLISSLQSDGETNLMALSWWMYVSNNPAMVAVCLSQRGHSSLLIKQTGEFGLCTVDEELREAAFNCGTHSGRSVSKASEFGIELKNAEVIRPKLVLKSRAALECRVVQTIPAGDHNLFIAEVVAAHENDKYRQLFAVNGYSALEPV